MDVKERAAHYLSNWQERGIVSRDQTITAVLLQELTVALEAKHKKEQTIMGREIRRVPSDWQHPKDDDGDYKRLYDNDYHSAAREWIEAFDLWRKGEHPSQLESCKYYWEYSNPPDEESYRERVWTAEEATAYQIYETVSEGTPVSPIFLTLDDMVDWLVTQGYSRIAAERFAESGWAPSMVMYRSSEGVSIANDIESHSLMAQQDD